MQVCDFLHIFLTALVSTYRLILETDPPTIASRVSMRGAESDIPLTDRVSEVGFAGSRASVAMCKYYPEGMAQ